MDKEKIKTFLSYSLANADYCWGIGVSFAGDVDLARNQGAAWVLANHAGLIDSESPSSAIGLLPYADANGAVLSMSAMLDETADIPVIAAVFASDQFRLCERHLAVLAAAGFSAVQNFPTVGLAEGRFKSLLSEAEMGYEREVDMIRVAGKMGLFCSAIVFSREQAEMMLDAGADMLVMHPGYHADGEYREWNATTRKRLSEIAELASSRYKDVILARTAFEQYGSLDSGIGISLGIQYDKNIRISAGGKEAQP